MQRKIGVTERLRSLNPRKALAMAICPIIEVERECTSYAQAGCSLSVNSRDGLTMFICSCCKQSTKVSDFFIQFIASKTSDFQWFYVAYSFLSKLIRITASDMG